MMIPRPTEEDRELFKTLAPVGAGVEVKPMFGNLGAFLQGNMFMGLFASDIGLKLGDDDARELLRIDGAGPFGPKERPMGGYVTIPALWRSTPDKAQLWIEKSINYVGSPPAKARAGKRK